MVVRAFWANDIHYIFIYFPLVFINTERVGRIKKTIMFDYWSYLPENIRMEDTVSDFKRLVKAVDFTRIF